MSDNTEEYQAEYDKAMAELEATANGKEPEATTAQAEEPEPETTDEQQEAAHEVDEVAELRRQLEEARKEAEAKAKALSDTQRWAHENARRLKEMERQAAPKPEILQSIPELEEAVKYVTKTSAEQEQETRQQSYEQALGIVFNAHPDAPELLRSDPEFYKAMKARRETVGAEKFDTDPLVMIREITAEKLARAKRLAEAEKLSAIEAARKEAEAKAKAKASMTMPGAAAGASRTPSSGSMSADDVWNMSPEAFRKWQSKVTGF